MKVVSAAAFNNLDHHDVKELADGSEKMRRKYRLQIIKNFMAWAKKQDPTTFN
jgi:hypothetical protein